MTDHTIARRLAAGALGASLLAGGLCAIVTPAYAGERAPARSSAQKSAAQKSTAEKAASAQRASGSRSDNAGSTRASGSGTTGTNGLQPQTVAVMNDIRARFPQITTIGGVRPDSLPDHPSGHALDLMIPDPTSAQGRALGDEVAAYLRENSSRLEVSYVIWRQQIWNTRRAGEGWRTMADRGGATANHMDHVHVTVN